MAGVEGKWMHAHEEDADGAMVFRPASHPLPPSRGRLVLDLSPDGSAVQIEPGPTDAPVDTHVTWSLDGDRLTVGERRWSVVSVDAERLVRQP